MEERAGRPKSLVRRVFTDPRYCVAFGFGSGLVPKVPGTAGTVVGLLLFYPLSTLGPVFYGLVVIVTLVSGIWICGYVAAQLEAKDPGGIVLDEIVGLWIGLFMVPAGWYWLLAGFVSFRLLDILKPWPANWLDRNLGGGAGIMLDDVAAGIYTLAVMQSAQFVMMTG